MLLLRLLFRSHRRFGFWRTLFAFGVLAWVLFFVAKALASPPGPPPINPRYFWGDDGAAFTPVSASFCTADRSLCPTDVWLAARLLNFPTRSKPPLQVQLQLSASTTCLPSGCNWAVLSSAQHRRVYLFINGRRANYEPLSWHWVSGSATVESGGYRQERDTFVSDPLVLGFSGCGWVRLNFGLLGDSWKGGTVSDDGTGSPTTYSPIPARWAFAVPLPVYLGDCSKGGR